MNKTLCKILIVFSILIMGFSTNALAKGSYIEPRLACPWCRGSMKLINRAVLYTINCPTSSGKEDAVYEYTYECKSCGEIDAMISQVICKH